VEKELTRMKQAIEKYEEVFEMDELKELIKKHEGLRLKPYRCSAGKLTIGYGHNLDDKGITEHEAELMLDRDIAQAKQDLFMVLGELVNALTPKRYNALVDMMFNLGAARFRGFKKMIAAIQENDWTEAAGQALDSKWADQVKFRAIRDAEMMKYG
jgi:lysozyme